MNDATSSFSKRPIVIARRDDDTTRDDDDDDDDDDGDDACARVARAHGATCGDADRDGGVHDDATSLRF